jgi:hypothetical protein
MSVAAIPPPSYQEIHRFAEAMALVDKGRIVEAWKGALKAGDTVPAGVVCGGDRGVLVRAHGRWTCDTLHDSGVVSLAGPSEGEAPPYVTVEQLRGLARTGKLPPWRMRATVLGRSVLVTHDEDRDKRVVVKGLVSIDLEATRADIYPDTAYLWLKSPRRTVYLNGRLDRIKGGEAQCTFAEVEPAARSLAELEALLK